MRYRKNEFSHTDDFDYETLEENAKKRLERISKALDELNDPDRVPEKKGRTRSIFTEEQRKDRQKAYYQKHYDHKKRKSNPDDSEL